MISISISYFSVSLACEVELCPLHCLLFLNDLAYHRVQWQICVQRRDMTEKKKKKNAVKKKKKTHTITNLLHQFITGFFFLIKDESGHFQLESHLPALMSPFETNWVPKPGSMFIKLQAHLRAWKTKQTQKNNFTFCDARKIENLFTCAVVSCAC